MATSRVLEPPRDLSPQNRIQEQIVANHQRITAIERAVVEPLRQVGGAGQPGFTNSWINNDNSASSPSGTAGHRNTGFYRDGSRVFLQGAVRGGASGTSVFTLPDGYRPAQRREFTVPASGSTAYATVNTNGTVVLNNVGSSAVTTLTILDTISFRV